MNLVAGAGGRLGQALMTRLGPEACAVPRAMYRGWAGADKAAPAAVDFSAFPTAPSTIFVCAGLLDPGASAEALHRANVELPQRLIRAAAPLQARVVTFGTVMEGIGEVSNPYIESKRVRSRFVESLDDGQVLHIRLHTLYGGGAPTPFMFLGQAYAALLAGTPFAMTEGRQLREYHHVDDEADAVIHLAHGDLAEAIVTLRHGSTLSLRALATDHFAHLGEPGQLRLGARPEPPAENFDLSFPPTALPGSLGYRDSISGVRDYLAGALSEARNG